MFKNLLARVGVGGAAVDAELSSAQVRPGEAVQGRVRLTGGKTDQEIQGISVGLAARVQVSMGDAEMIEDVEFHRVGLAEAFSLDAGAEQMLPFSLDLPWETPPNVFGGQRLPRIEVGVHTEVAIAGAVDTSDLDPLAVQALPAQEHILSVLGQLGFRFSKADLETGRIRGVDQRLPFFQEIELRPVNRRYPGLNELEVSFITGPRTMAVVLEADKRDGLFVEGRDTYGQFTVDHASFAQDDWAATLDRWLSEVGSRRGWF